MSADLLISVSPGELRAALVEDGRVIELRIERAGASSRVGEIHLGRVMRLLPALPAALVDIGIDRPAFLSQEDAVDLAPEGRRGDGISAWLHQGRAILVQVTRDAQGEKAVGLTARLRLAGRLLTLTPTRAKIAHPRGCDAEQREQMETLLGGHLPPQCGIVIGTAAVAAKPEAIQEEAAMLQERWATLQRRAREAAPPALIETENEPLGRLLAGVAEWQPERVLIDDRAGFAAARAWLARNRPDVAPRLAPDLGEGELFDRHDVAEAVANATAPRVRLPGDASIVIEPTTAMTVIDVDGGGVVKRRGHVRMAILEVNIAAAEEAARQIRLRNLAGAIVVDFISMERRADRDKVLEAFARRLEGDPGEPQILGWTRLGHVELTRRRRHPPLAEILCERPSDGGWVKSTLTTALEALRVAARQAAKVPSGSPTLVVHPAVAAALDGPAALARRELQADLARPVAVHADPTLPRESFDIRFD